MFNELKMFWLIWLKKKESLIFKYILKYLNNIQYILNLENIFILTIPNI